jgi:hypothetical protein
VTLDSAHNNSHICNHTVPFILLCFPTYTHRLFVDGISQISPYYHDFGCVTVRRRLDWILDLLTTLYTPLGTTGNYSAIANLHNSQFTTAPAKSLPACCVLTNRSLATVSNSGDSSAARVQVPPSPTLLQDCLLAIYSGTLSPILRCSCQLSTISLPSLPDYCANCQLRRLPRFSVN